MSLLIHKEYLVDTYALAYLHSPEMRDLLVLLLSKFKIKVSALSLTEFLAYLHFKHRDTFVLETALNLISKIYSIEGLDRDVILKASAIMSDLVSKGETIELVELYNATIASLRNVPIITDDPLRYAKYFKYNVTAISVENFVEQFKSMIESRLT